METGPITFDCTVCAMKFARKDNFDRHLETKKHKDRIESNDKHSRTGFNCLNCSKSYLYRSGLSKHRHQCKIKNSVPIEEVEEMKCQFEKEKEAMQKQIEELILSRNNIHTNNNIGTQVNITINAFGKENIDYITEKQCLKIVNQVFNSIPAAAQIVYFNPEHPENHNIKIPNKKEPYAMIMKADQTWEMTDRKKAIETMTQKSYGIAEDSFGKVYDKIAPNKRETFEKFMDKMNDQDSSLWGGFKKDLEMKVIGATREIK
jgi:hypothetical protein